jgi:hypothetical protein
MARYDNLITGRTFQHPDDSRDVQGAPDASGAKLVAGNSLPAGGVTEYRFHPTRKWRFDWAWPDRMVALEIEGGAWTGGRHTRGKGFVADMEKYNAAALAGWRVLRVTPQQVKSGEAGRLVRLALIG